MRTQALRWLVFLAALQACDFVTGPRPPAELIDYVHTTRIHLQILHRWWPLLAPTQHFANPAFGVLPFELPTSYQTDASTSSELAEFALEPTHFWCDSTCVVEWRESESNFPHEVSVFVGANGRIDSGRALLASPSGDWLLRLDANGAVSDVSLQAGGDGLLTDWRFAPGDGSGVFAVRRGAAGAVQLTQATLAATVETSSWPALSKRLPLPTKSSSTFAIGGKQMRRVDFADGSSNYSAMTPQSNEFAWNSMGVTAVSSSFADETWTIRVAYAPQQELQQISSQVRRTVVDGEWRKLEIIEDRILRFGIRRHIEIRADNYGDFVQVQWEEADSHQGSVRIRSIDLGWQIEAFWDSGRGDLIKVEAQALALGFWLGSFSGWSRADIETPTEIGEWTMLADGSFFATLLFKQIDETLAPVSVTAPPEGALLTPVD